MNLSRTTRPLALVAVAVAALGAAADPPADALLKEKGLRRSGTSYLLPAESDVQKALNAARAASRDVSALAQQKSQYEAQLDQAQAEMVGTEQRLILLNQQISQATNVQEHNQLAGTINALSGQLNLLRRQAGDEGRQAAGARLASRREDFIDSVFALRKLVDETSARYAALAADPEVAETLKGLNTPDKRIKMTLGPSKTYLASVATLEKVESTVLSEDVALRKEGGVYWVDVSFNGKVNRPMVFDTGASSVVLPAELAKEIGLKESPTDTEVTAKIADGTEVKARKMTIPSVRVGKFIVRDVECVVMPAGKKDVPPLLGQSFQRNFSIKFNAGAGTLHLSKLETGDEPAAPSSKAAGKSKSSTKAGRKSR